MRTILAVLAVTLIASAAEGRAENPGAGHAQEPAPDPHSQHAEESADPHSEHAQESAADPHSEHVQEPAADPHTGHGQDAPASDPHVRHENREPPPAAGRPPEAAFSGPRHAADRVFEPAAMARARAQLRAEHGAMQSYGLAVDRFELQNGGGAEDYAWEAQAWYGGDTNQLWLKTEGEGSFGGDRDAEVQALWSRAITPWFDLQAGLRYDWTSGPDRGYLVLGLQGLTPYLFEVDAAAFISEDGDIEARFEAGYDLRLTQRLVLQPAAEIEVAAADVPELGIGSGISAIDLGLRLRYEMSPGIAPYVGVEWERKVGETADFARRAGTSTNDLFTIAGLKFWF